MIAYAYKTKLSLSISYVLILFYDKKDLFIKRETFAL